MSTSAEEWTRINDDLVMHLTEMGVKEPFVQDLLACAAWSMEAHAWEELVQWTVDWQDD